jgi:hypothetical protein
LNIYRAQTNQARQVLVGSRLRLHQVLVGSRLLRVVREYPHRQVVREYPRLAHLFLEVSLVIVVLRELVHPHRRVVPLSMLV